MKTNIKLLTILITLILSVIINTEQASAQQIVSYQVFYDQLSPYGYWVNRPNYGYVWLPNAGPDFAPYATNGYWVMTDYGMTWVSNYNWGWAPFHYGRWDYDDFYGWFWVPGNEWGPAWVTWRWTTGYYGWAPMQPGISITISFGNHYYSNWDHWVFVRDRDIDRHDVHRCYVTHQDRDVIIRNSTVINNTYIDNSNHTTYVAGPRRDDLQRNLGRNVRTASVQENNSPGQDLRNDRLNIYRPRITENNNRKENTTPVRLTDINDVRYRTNNNSANREQSNNIDRNKSTNQSDNIKKRIQQNVNQSNDNYRRQQQQINQSNNSNRTQNQNSNQSNEVKRNQNQINENMQNKNNNKNISPSGNIRKENQQNTIKPSTNSRNESTRVSRSDQSNNRKIK